MLGVYFQITMGMFLNVVTSATNMIKENSVFMIYLVAGLIMLGFSVFKSARKSVK